MIESKDCKDCGKAIKEAIKWLKNKGVLHLDEYFDSKLLGLGMRTSNRKAGLCLEFNDRTGGHINIWYYNERGPLFTFQENEQLVRANWQQLIPKHFKTYGEALDEALSWLKNKGVLQLEEAYESNDGFGMRTSNEKAGYRLEFDKRSGAHINAWFHHDKSPHFTFVGNKKDVEAKWRQLFHKDVKVIKRSSNES